MNFNINNSIIREYDIRGIYGETLTNETAFFIGKAFATYIKNKTTNNKIVVGYDGRISSPNIEKSLIDGLISVGSEVIRVGLGPSPYLYFAAHYFNADGAIIVTGSHNPKNHNGFKFMMEKDSLHGEAIKELAEISSTGSFLPEKEGSVKNIIVKKEYIAELLSQARFSDEIKVAWDPGNGAAGEITEEICKQLPGKHYLINEKIDGNFPSHHPDPTVEENLKQLASLVKEKNCDLGVAFDGDADRLGVIDKKGRMIAGDLLLIIFSQQILNKNPGATIIADIKASNIFISEIKKLGGVPVIWKAGHSLIKSKMKETGALLAGEMSGHLFFSDEYYGFDDGIYAAIRLINYISKSNLSLDNIIDSLPKTFSTPEYRINCPEEKKFVAIENIKNKLAKTGVKYLDIDGVRTELENGWWLIRASNTQAALSARCEANSEQELEKIKHEMLNLIKAEGIEIKSVSH